MINAFSLRSKDNTLKCFLEFSTQVFFCFSYNISYIYSIYLYCLLVLVKTRNLYTCLSILLEHNFIWYVNMYNKYWVIFKRNTPKNLLKKIFRCFLYWISQFFSFLVLPLTIHVEEFEFFVWKIKYFKDFERSFLNLFELWFNWKLEALSAEMKYQNKTLF